MEKARAARRTTDGTRRKRRIDRATPAEIEAMPALLTTAELSRIMGFTPEYVSTLCTGNGVFAGLAVKCGRGWTVSKAKALQALGLD